MASKEARPRSGRVTAVRSQPVDSAPPAGQGEYSREWCGRLWVGESREDVDEAISEFEIAREAAARRDRRWPAEGTAAIGAGPVVPLPGRGW